MKILKLDFYKIFQKKGYLVCIGAVVLFVLSSAFAYSGATDDELNFLLQDFNAMKYIWLASTDILYQGTTLFSLMLLGIILSNLYLEDFKNGCYKYVIIAGVKKKSFFVGKVLFTSLIVGSFVVFAFLCVTIVGIIFWGTNGINLKEFLDAFLLYIVTIIPMVSFLFLLYDIALIIKNVRVINFIAVVLPLILGIVDSLSITKNFSPIGLLTIFNQSPPTEYIPHISQYLVIEVLWLAFFVIMNYIIQKQYQDTMQELRNENYI